MVVKRSQPAEEVDLIAANEETMEDQDPRSFAPSIKRVDYPSPTAFDDVRADDLNLISSNPWFTCHPVLRYADDDFAAFVRYAWDEEFFRVSSWMPRLHAHVETPLLSMWLTFVVG